MLRGDKGLDESVGALGVEGKGVAERGQLGALLHVGLLQAVPARVEVLLREAQIGLLSTLYDSLMSENACSYMCFGPAFGCVRVFGSGGGV